ncbi:MAG: ABC transporter ATP-binding protein [Shewanella sp.]
MIQTKNLSFSYAKTTPFLTDLELQIPEGKITTILGPNGSGKSTLLQLLATNLRPKAGNIVINGEPAAKLSKKKLAQMLAIVQQHQEVPTDMSVRELVAFGRTPHQHYFQRESATDAKHIEWAMAQTHISKLATEQVANLSGGERQRVFIAMALAQKAPILFLDEPTTYLDIYHQFEILELVKHLNHTIGLTVVMVLHDLNQAHQYSDEIIMMKNGAIVQAGATATVMTSELLKHVYHIDATIITNNNTKHIIVSKC